MTLGIDRLFTPDEVDPSDLSLGDFEFDSLEEPTESATERFEDDVIFDQVAWDHSMALKVTRVDPAWSRQRQVERLQGAIDDGELPDEAIERLIDAGYRELA